MGEFIDEHASAPDSRSSAARDASAAIATGAARGRASCRICAASCRRTAATIAHWDSSDDALAFANSQWAEELCAAGHELSRSLPAHADLARCSCPWDPATEGLDALKERIAARAEQLPRGLRRLLQVVRRRDVAGAARFESVGRGHSRARPFRIREGQARSADHDRVLRQRHSRDGRRERARGRRSHARPRCRRRGVPEQARALHELPQLRRAAAARGVPHRVLGARGGQAAAHAARA